MAGVVGTEDLRRAVGYALQVTAVAACYFASGRLGLMRQLVVDGAVVTPIWPPTGVAVACLLLFGIRIWPGIALGALLVVMSITSIEFSVIGTLVGNTAAPVLAYYLLRRVGFRTDLTRLRDGFALVFLAALTAMLLSATVGTVLLVLTGKLNTGDFWFIWSTWYVGDAMGVLIVTPVLLVLWRVRRLPRTRRWKEAVGLALIAGVVIPFAARTDISMLFLVYPLVILAALRFQLVGSMLCAALASVMVTITATDQIGPFAHMTRVEVMIKLQAFNGAMALTALLLSAVITEQLHTRRSVEQACRELVEVLEHLTAGESPRGRSPGQSGDEGSRQGKDQSHSG